MVDEAAGASTDSEFHSMDFVSIASLRQSFRLISSITNVVAQSATSPSSIKPHSNEIAIPD